MLLKGDTKRKKWEYFKDYYLRTFLLSGILIFGGIYFLYTSFFGYRETAVDVMFVETAELDLETVKAGLEAVLDTEGEEIVVEKLSEEAALSQTVLATRIAAGDVDIFIADRQVFLEYAKKGAMEDLKETLPEDLYEKAEKHLIFEQIQEVDAHGDAAGTGEERPYGISLQGMSSIKEIEALMPDPVLGIIKGADDLEMEWEVVRFFIR